MSGRRTITIDGRQWRYLVGKCFCVAKAVEDGEGRKIKLNELTGMAWPDIERGRWKGWFHVTPVMIARWLRKPAATPTKTQSSA